MIAKLFRSVAFLSVLAGFGSARAETWTARCSGLEFQFDKTARTATVFVVTDKGALFPIAQGAIQFDNGVALRATLRASATALLPDSPQVGLNRSRNVVYVQTQNPLSGEVTSGKFCDVKIDVK